MWSNPFSDDERLPAKPDYITLLDERIVYTSDLFFNRDLYHFFQQSTGDDLTELIRRADKLAIVPDFDVTRENLRVSNERGIGEREGKRYNDDAPTNTWDVFTDQIVTDPFSAPGEAVENTANRFMEGVNRVVKKALTTPGIVIIGVAIYLYSNRK